MPAVSIFALLVVVVVVLAPLALYWFVGNEEPDGDGADWNEARRRARNDDGTRSTRKDDSRRGSDQDEDETDGNHWN
jgi:hypothetical protein